MKKYYFFIIVMVSCLNCCSKEPIEPNTLIKEINDYRASKNISSMQKNPSLFVALQQLIPKTEGAEITTNKDSIRSVLKSLNIYDYQINLLVLNFNDLYNLNKLIKDNPTFLSLIQNPNYNNINYLVLNDRDKKYLVVIATQNFIDFDESLLFESSFLDGGGTQDYITLSGKSRAYPLKFALNNNINANYYNDSKLTLNDVNVKNDGSFSVKIDLTQIKIEKLNHIAFINTTGEIIANFKLREND